MNGVVWAWERHSRLGKGYKQRPGGGSWWSGVSGWGRSRGQQVAFCECTQVLSTLVFRTVHSEPAWLEASAVWVGARGPGHATVAARVTHCVGVTTLYGAITLPTS